MQPESSLTLEASPGSQTLQLVPLAGPSMLPTLRPMDLLEIRPYGERPVRVGDVVAFQKPGGSAYIVHRVIRAGWEGIRTLGDNNRYEDAADLSPEDLAGRVVAAWRGQARRRVYSGAAGRLLALVVRAAHRADGYVSPILRPAYRALSRKGTLRALLPDSLRPRVVRFGERAGASMTLLFLGRPIGHYDVRRRCWFIRRPFKLFVDEGKLPGKTAIS